MSIIRRGCNTEVTDFKLIRLATTVTLVAPGYAREAVVGKNCRFMQGTGTCKEEVARLHEAVHSQHPLPVTVSALQTL